MNAEPVYVDVNTQEGLNDTDEKNDHVVPALEEAKAQSPDNKCRDQREHDEAAKVVPVRDIASANRSRREEMAQKARNEEDYPEPGARLVSQGLGTSTAGLGRSRLWLDLRRLYVRSSSCSAAIWCDRVFGLRLLR